MAFFENTLKSSKPGCDRYGSVPDEISCVFRFGKDHRQAICCEPIEQSEREETERQSKEIMLTTLAASIAIRKIKSELKMSCSLQVHSFDGSLISVFNTQLAQSESSDFTTLEPSFELPVDDSSFIQDLLNADNLSTTFPDLDLDLDYWQSNLPSDPNINDLFDIPFTPDMTFKELESMPMQHDENVDTAPTVPSSSSSLPIVSALDETTMSSASSTSDDTERDDINRRGIKKSGGPVRKLARFGNKQVIKYSNEYHDRRVKNNEAVKKSRSKAKDKQKETEVKMNKLSDENRHLTDRVDMLMKELQVLKSLYKELNQELPTDAVRALERVNVR